MQANIKSEAYGYAIADTTKAIKLDPKFVKACCTPVALALHVLLVANTRGSVMQAYFRRGLALAAILKPKEALKDFRECVRLDPGNKDAKLKLEECKKIVRKLEFFAAIDVGDEPSASEGLDVDSIAVEPDYDGARLGSEMTQEFIDDMMIRFREGKKIHRKYVYQIILAVKDIVYKEPTMVEMEIPPDTKLTVCGDTHGRFALSLSRGDSANSSTRSVL